MGCHRVVICCLEVHYRLTTGKVPAKQDGPNSGGSFPRPVRKCENREEQDGLVMVVSDLRRNFPTLSVHDDRQMGRASRLLMVFTGQARCSSLPGNVLTPQTGGVVWCGSRSVYTMRENRLTS